MKKILFLFAIGIPLLAASCDKGDNPPPITDIPPPFSFDSLPPITTKGWNTFGCKVNGEIWVPNINNRIISRRIEASYYPPTGGFSISGTKRLDDEGIFESLGFAVTGLFAEQSMELGDALYLNYDTSFCINYEFNIDTLLSHKLEIIRLDNQEHTIVSGTFEFTAINDECNPIVVTDGRFDIAF